MPLIMPIKDLRNTTEISNIAHKEQEPIFITKNGYSDLVVMSSELYDKFARINHIDQAIFESEQKIANGAEAVDAEIVFIELEKKILDRYKVKVNPRAIRELDCIYEYIANEKFAPENAKEQVLRFHSQLIEQTGGINGVRDFNLLESAIEIPFQVFAGEELYPIIQAKRTRPFFRKWTGSFF